VIGKLPAGIKLMPHKHPEDRVYTVMSGVFYIGLGHRFYGLPLAWARAAFARALQPSA
jgi:hypothetical protein